MPEFRCRATDFCMSEAMPFQQHWEYRTTWPIAEILNEKFFASMKNTLRPGDAITICRYDGFDPGHKNINLLEVADVRVLVSGEKADGVKLGLVGDIVVMGEAGLPVPEYSIQKGFAGKYRLHHGDVFVEEFGSKTEAEAALILKTQPMAA